MADEIRCPNCDKAYRWKPQIAGRKVRCQCTQMFRVPDEAGDPIEAIGPLVSAPPEPQPEDQSSDPYELDLPSDLPPPAPAKPAAARPTPSNGKCPSCNSPLRPGAVICLNCGFNVQDGAKIKTVVDQGPAPVAVTGQAMPTGGLGADADDERVRRATQRANYDDQVAMDVARKHHFQENILPLILAGIGLVLLIANVMVLYPKLDEQIIIATRVVPNAPIQVEALVLSAVKLFLQVPCLLAGLFAIAAMFGSSFGDLFTAMKKLVALALLTGQLEFTVEIGMDIMLHGMGSVAWMLQAAISFTVFWIAAKQLFDELEVNETIGLWFAVGFVPTLLLIAYFLVFG